MFKLIGAAAVILASGMLGIAKYNEFYERKRVLQAIRDGSQKIRSSLSCMCLPLYECFLSGGVFFEKAALYMREGNLPSEAVRNSALEQACLKKEDREIIFRFADGLSAQDCNGQLANIELFLKEIERCMENAAKELSTKGTLFVKGSILAAIAVVLVLI